MATTRQTSFAAGELSPYLHGRSDLELYAHGARRLSNFFVSPQGAAVSRPGTRYTATCKGTGAVILIPFIAADAEAYVLEVGELYTRVIQPDNPTHVVELATPYRAVDLPRLQWAQVGTVLTLTHPSYPAAELLSPTLGLASWLYRPVLFGPPASTPSGTQSMTPVFRTRDNNLVMGPMVVRAGVDPDATLFVGDEEHPPREWRWKVTALLRNDTTGQVVESSAFDVTESFDGTGRPSIEPLPADNLIVLYADRAVRLRHPAFGPLIGTLSGHTGWTPVGVNFYRGRGYGSASLFGLVGTTQHAQDFVDIGEEPDYLIPPPRGEEPWASGEYPAAVSFYQARRVFAGSTRRPSTLWASAVDDWSNHDAPRIPYPEQPLEVTLAGRKREAVRAVVPGRRLLVFTDCSVWSVGGEGGVWSYETMADVRLEDEVGSSELPPLVVDGTVLYVRARGRGVRALTLGDNGVYQPQDVTWHAEHLFRGAEGQLVSWCYARDPWATIWAVRADGVLLSCTRTGPSTWAWAKHDTGLADGDRVLSVASVPFGGFDAVHLAVRRGAAVYIERLRFRDRQTEVPLPTSPGDAAFALDSSIDKSFPVGGTETLTGLGRLEGRLVWVVPFGNPPQGPFRVTGGAVTVGPCEVSNNVDDTTVACIVGLAFTPELELLDAAGARLQQKTVVKVGLEVDSAIGLEVGQDFQHLVAWRQRDVIDGYVYPSAATALVVITPLGRWDRTGRAAVRQPKPLPLIVLGVAREMDVGGS